MGGAASVVVEKRAICQEVENRIEYEPKNGPFWSMEASTEQDCRLPPSGKSFIQEDTKTFLDLIDVAAKVNGYQVMMRVERPCPPLGEDKSVPPPLPLSQWKTWTFEEGRKHVRAFAKSCLSFGMIQHDSVVIYGFNSPEWMISAYGAMYAGGKSAGIYPSDTPEQLKYKTLHSNAAIASLEAKPHFERMKSVIDHLPYLKVIVVWETFEGMPKSISRSDGSTCEVRGWEEYLEYGNNQPDAALTERRTKIKPGHCCSLIYTSGTTGQPKAVMISHHNLLFTSNSFRATVRYHIPELFAGGNVERAILSYLPLSHIAGMMMDMIVPLICTARGSDQPFMSVGFARPYDLKVGSLVDRLKAIRPHLFLGVPRVWEKMEEKLRAIGAKTKGNKAKLVKWAKGKGLEQKMNLQLGGSGKVPFGYGIAEKLVLSKVKEKLGLDRTIFGVTGAAPIRLSTQEFFAGLGISICEVYGMSECTGVTTISTPLCNIWGSVGFATAGVEVKVFKVDERDFTKKTECPPATVFFKPTEEEQGELCYRGPHIMLGYFANPKLGQGHLDEIRKKNVEAIDEEGWLHSGDKGTMSQEGFFRITGRYKELILGAGGENIAPVPIEDCVKQFAAISNAVMIGDKRKYNVMLITLKAVGATGELPGGDELDPSSHGISPGITKVSEAMKDQAWIQRVTLAIQEANMNGDCCPSNASKVQKFTILPRDLSVATGDLTATLKLKRSVVEEKYKKQIDHMYEASGTYIPFQE